MDKPQAANAPYKLPPPLFDARCKACWFTVGLVALVVASFWSLDLQWGQFLSLDAARSMGRFVGEFFPPDLSAPFLHKVAVGAWETLAMSLLGTALAAAAGLALALPASRLHEGDAAWGRAPTRLVLNALRSIPELVWAALLVGNGRVFLYATLPQVLPQLASYTLYRWENNIRAAAVLGVVGAGGLGQLLVFHMGLFHMGKTATILGAMLAMVALVDALSYGARRGLTR